MLTRNRTLIALILGVLVVAVTACALVRQLNGVATAGSPTTLPSMAPTSPAAATPTPSTSPTPSATPTLSKTQTDITAAVTNYYKVTDELEQKPPRDPYKKLFTVTKGEAFLMWQDEITNAFTNGQHATGSTKVTEIVTKSILQKSGRSAAKVDTCVDVSNVDVVDKKGKSVVPPDRPDRFSSRLQLEKYGKTWLVITDRDGSQKC